MLDDEILTRVPDEIGGTYVVIPLRCTLEMTKAAPSLALTATRPPVMLAKDTRWRTPLASDGSWLFFQITADDTRARWIDT